MADGAQYSIQRFDNGAEVHRQDYLDHKTVTGIVEIFVGTVPDTLAAGGDLDEEWKFSFGEGIWVLVVRQK